MFATDSGSGLPFVDVCGDRRLLGCLPPKLQDRRFGDWRNYRGLVPRGEWAPVSYRSFSGNVLDQNGQGSCVGHGSLTTFVLARGLAGATPVDLSPCFLYGLINGGRDQGALVSDAMDALSKTGVCLLSEVPEKRIFSRDFPASAYQTAKRFRTSRAFRLSTFDEIASALLTGFGVSFGIEIGQAFNPGPDGVVPERSGGGGGHCMAAVGLYREPRTGRWYLEVQNSWSTAWGAGGYCYLPESYFRGYVDAFAIQAAVEDPLDPNRPPNVV